MMDFCIVVSEKDPAGMNIMSCLIHRHGFTMQGDIYQHNGIKLAKIEEDTLYSDNIDKRIDADLFIFATKHSSASGVNSLSVHVPGNWGRAEHGGKESTLCIAPGSYIKEGLKALNEIAGRNKFEITVEQTHHGPYLEKPCIFIEIGSNMEQWQDSEAGIIIADAIMKIISAEPTYPAALMLGGGHYNIWANRILLETEYAIGHICSRHSLEDLDMEMLMQALDKTCEAVELVIIDWKGLGSWKTKVMGLLDEAGVKYERARNMIKRTI